MKSLNGNAVTEVGLLLRSFSAAGAVAGGVDPTDIRMLFDESRTMARKFELEKDCGVSGLMLGNMSMPWNSEGNPSNTRFNGFEAPPANCEKSQRVLDPSANGIGVGSCATKKPPEVSSSGL